MLNLKEVNLKEDIHVYRQGDLMIAYDVNSGSLHVLDEPSYALLRSLIEMDVIPERHSVLVEKLRETIDEIFQLSVSAAEVEEILSELEELRKEGTLFSTAEKIEPHYPEKPIVKAICLHVAHDCNLRCEYCFAGTGAFGGDRTMMDIETGKKAIDFVLEASGHRNHCEVDFFGGEPLLNFPVVKELVKYGREAAERRGKAIKFTMTTNGVLLNEEIEKFLADNDISVVLSLDGRREVHDRMRPYPDGSGSYDEVVPAIQRFVAQHPESSPYAVGTYYYVRGTYTHHNLDFDKDVLHMVDLGINRISLEPVVASPKDSYAFREGDLDKIKESYDRLAEEILKRREEGQDFTFFHFNVALDQGPCLPKRLTGCGAGHEYVAISPEGDLYPCHQFVGQPEYKLGSLWGEKGGELDPNLVKRFRGAHVYAKPSCRGCWARYACSGGCHAANVAFTNDLLKVYPLGCELQKKRLEVALYLKAKEAQKSSEN